MATRRRGRALIFVAVILILLLVLAWAALRMFGPVLNPATPVIEPTPMVDVSTPTPEVVTVDIVMTTQQVARGGVISADIVALVPMPAHTFVPGSFFQTLDEVVGKRARYDIKPNTPVSAGLIVDGVSGPTAFQIPRGMVAISVPIGKLSSVSYGLQPGDHVNLIASMQVIDVDPNFQTANPNRTTSVTLPGALAEQFTGTATIGDGVMGRAEYDPTIGAPIYVIPGEENQRPRLVSQTLIQDAVVLQMGIFAQGEPTVAQPVATDPNAPQDPNQQAAAPAPIAVPDVITLIVSPQDAVSLNYLILSGAKLNLVMRSAGDDSIYNTEAVTMQFILDQYGFPIPAKLPYVQEDGQTDIMSGNFVTSFPEAGQPVINLPAATPIPNTSPESQTFAPTAEPAQPAQ